MNSPCNVPNCINPVSARGLCKTHRNKYYKTGEFSEYLDKAYKNKYTNDHLLGNIDLELKTAFCVVCGPVNVVVSGKSKTPTCSIRKQEENRKYYYPTQYGITYEEKIALLETQQGVCALCESPVGVEKSHVDHDHFTGVVREILCSSCNMGLGLFKEDVSLFKRAIAYLDKHGH